MSAYIVATVRVTDPAAFALYAQGIAGLNERFGGEYVVRGPIAEVMEGAVDPGERVVILRFPDADAARAFIHSPEYQAAKAHRIGAAELEMRLLVDPA